MEFEDILAGINSFGKFQIMVVILQSMSRLILPCHFLLNNFMAAVPDHRCRIPGLDDGDATANLTQDQWLTVSIPAQEDGTLSSCKMFREPQFHLLHDASNATEIPAVPCQHGWVYDTSTFASTVATEWDLVCDRKGMSKALGTIFFVGVMCGAVAFGTLSDRFGRKTMLLVSCMISISFGIASAFSTSYTMFAILRFLTGFGLVGIAIITVVLCIEWVAKENRAFIGVVGGMSWSLGNMMLAGIASCVNEWRLLTIAVTAPLGLAIITWWWIPESARWLLANGEVEKAHKYLMKCATFNNEKEFASKITLETLSNAVTVDDKSKKYTYLDLVRTPNMRKRVAITGVLWYGVASTYYGIGLDIASFGLNIYLTQFIYAVIEVPAKILVYFSLNGIGRRKTQVGTLILTGMCIVVNIFTPRDKIYFRTSVGVLGKGFSEATFTAVYLYTTELYPTVVRQNGMGYTSFIGRMGVAIAPLILLLDDVWRHLPQVILCSVAIFTGLLASLLPETHNELLPETIEDVEQTRKKSKSPSAQEKNNSSLKPLTSDATERV